MKKTSKTATLMATTTLYGAMVAAMAFTGAAQAQTTDTPTAKESTPKPAAKKAEAETTEVTVVGSRIRKNTFNSASPIQVITREETTLAGMTSTAQVLQSTATTGGASQINNAYGGYVVNGGGGVNTLSLRGLGAGRTLVLINGRRVSPAGTRGSIGSADLNVLPNALIGRIDVLRDGASAIYGSDAIGGVVNIITRNVDGVQMEVMGSNPVHGGGNQLRASVAAGHTWNKLRVQGSLEYYEQQPLSLADRDWTQCNTDYQFNKTTGVTTDYIDPLTGQPKCYPITGTGSNGVTINTLGTATASGVGAAGSVGTSFNRWRPNSAITTGLAGFEGVGGGSNNLNVRDTFDKRTLNQSLISPSKVSTAFTQFNYRFEDATDSELYGEVLVNHRSSDQVGYRQLSLDYAPGSTLIPSNIAAIAGNAGTGSTISAASGGAYKARAFIGFGNYVTSESDDYAKAVLGIRGNVPFLNDWKYDVYLMSGSSESHYSFDTWLTDRMYNSLNVTTTISSAVPANLIKKDAFGNNVTCVINNTTNGQAGCIPAPVLNAATIGGTLPQDWINYTWTNVTGLTKFNETTFSANVNGPLFNLPAGAVQGAFGVEMRHDSIDDTPSADSVAGNLYNLTSSGVTAGSDAVNEAYAELEVPVFKDVFLAKTLDLQLAYRYTDYRSYGSDSTWKAGFVWAPADFLMFRASKGTSFRAPALFEQYLGSTTGFQSSSTDVCNNWNAPGVSSIRAANCQSEGLPTGFTATSSVTVITQGGAANHLSAETSDNTTIGMVFTPTFLKKDFWGDIAFAVDYFDIDIRNGVSNLSAGNILSLCYDDPRFRSGSPYCSFVTRNSSTKNLTVTAGYTNVSRQTAKGFDYDFRWNRKFGKLGVLVDLSVTKNTEQASQPLPSSALQDFNGSLRFPKYSGTLDTTFSYDKWKVHYGLELIGKQQSYDLLGLNKATTPMILDVPDYYLQNASVEYKAKSWVATVGIRNLADKKPPVISSGQYNRVGNALLYSGYDYVGRQVFVNVSKKF